VFGWSELGYGSAHPTEHPSFSFSRIVAVTLRQTSGWSRNNNVERRPQESSGFFPLALVAGVGWKQKPLIGGADGFKVGSKVHRFAESYADLRPNVVAKFTPVLRHRG